MMVSSDPALPLGAPMQALISDHNSRNVLAGAPFASIELTSRNDRAIMADSFCDIAGCHSLVIRRADLGRPGRRLLCMGAPRMLLKNSSAQSSSSSRSSFERAIPNEDEIKTC
jgi:hypothetical protein